MFRKRFMFNFAVSPTSASLGELNFDLGQLQQTSFGLCSCSILLWLLHSSIRLVSDSWNLTYVLWCGTGCHQRRPSSFEPDHSGQVKVLYGEALRSVDTNLLINDSDKPGSEMFWDRERGREQVGNCQMCSIWIMMNQLVQCECELMFDSRNDV